MTAAEPPPALQLRRDAVRDGWSDDELGRLVRSGELSRLRRGAYVDGTLPSDAAASHALLVRATLPGLRRPAVVGHQSAAVLQFDARVKYGCFLRPGEDAGDAVFTEKGRED